jgi:hypothetical protein
MYRRRLELVARAGRPAATLTVGDSGGRLCYVTASMTAAAIAVPLDADQVDDVIAALHAWRDERAADQQPFGRPCSSAQTTGQEAV